MTKKIRKFFVWMIILALLGAGTWHFFIREKEIDFTEETARTMTIETFYTFSGNLEPDSARVVSAGTRSSVRKWLVEEGDEVTKNDYIVEYNTGAQVRAPMDGTISDLYLDEGDEFNPGEALFRVADYAHPKVYIKVDEYDVSALKKDMAVDVKVLSTGKTIQGKIVRIAQEATVAGDLAYYAVEIDVEQDGSLVMGLTVEISVPRESAVNATTVSIDAIQYDEDEKPFVYCYDRNEEVEKQYVTLGINNGSVVEIREGLRSGEIVLIPPQGLVMPMMMMGR